jgi:hypothetical protein
VTTKHLKHVEDDDGSADLYQIIGGDVFVPDEAPK